MKDRHLISADELRAAGALDVPAAWRKSLGDGRKPRDKRNLLLFEDEGTLPEEQKPTPCHPDGDGSADELP